MTCGQGETITFPPLWATAKCGPSERASLAYTEWGFHSRWLRQDDRSLHGPGRHFPCFRGIPCQQTVCLNARGLEQPPWGSTAVSDQAKGEAGGGGFPGAPDCGMDMAPCTEWLVRNLVGEKAKVALIKEHSDTTNTTRRMETVEDTLPKRKEDADIRREWQAGMDWSCLIGAPNIFRRGTARGHAANLQLAVAPGSLGRWGRPSRAGICLGSLALRISRRRATPPSSIDPGRSLCDIDSGEDGRVPAMKVFPSAGAGAGLLGAVLKRRL